VKTCYSLLFAAFASMILLFSARASSEECQVTFSQPVVSFGQLKPSDIAASQKNWNRMPAKEITANVFCPEPRVMALFVQSTAGVNGGVLFGQDGRLAIIADNMVVDGHACTLAKTTDRIGFTPSSSPTQRAFIKNNEGLVARQNAAPVRGKHMSFTLKIVPVINNSQLRHVADNTLLESNMAWELLTQE
jgi:hypothetical protein